MASSRTLHDLSFAGPVARRRHAPIGRPWKRVGDRVEHRLHLARQPRARRRRSRARSPARRRAGSRSAPHPPEGTPSVPRSRRGPSASKRLRNSPASQSISSHGTPKAAATASRVMSSGVPPRPPVTKTYPARGLSARRNAAISSMSSRTAASRVTSRPMDGESPGEPGRVRVLDVARDDLVADGQDDRCRRRVHPVSLPERASGAETARGRAQPAPARSPTPVSSRTAGCTGSFRSSAAC